MSEHDGHEGAGPDECVVYQVDEGEEDWNPFDEFHAEVDLGPVPKVMAADGMPSNHAPYDDNRSDIPPFGPDTLICMGVFSEFVVRDRWGEIIARVPSEAVERSPNGIWRVRRAIFIQYNPDPRPTSPVRRWIEKQFRKYRSPWVAVEPIRPPCRHYLRQLAPYHMNPAYKKAFRLCALRRTTEGAMMDVSDLGMYSCDMREPRHPESDRHIDEFDRKKMIEGMTRKYLPLFAGAETKKSEGPGGIFNG